MTMVSFARKAGEAMTRKLIYCDESGEASFSPKSEFKYFDGYIETMLFKKAIAEGVSMNSVIRHEESHMSYGLQAVDFFAWSIYRAKNNQDRRFIKIFDHLVENKEEWYC